MFDKLDNALEENGFYIDERYCMIGSDENCCIDSFIEDFLLKNGAINVKTDITDAFNSPGYDCSVLSVAWIDTEGLHLNTILIEFV